MKSRRSGGFARAPRDALSAIHMRVAVLAGPFDEFKSISSAPRRRDFNYDTLAAE